MRDAREVLAPRAGNGGHACCPSRHFCVVVRARPVRSRALRSKMKSRPEYHYLN